MHYKLAEANLDDLKLQTSDDLYEGATSNDRRFKEASHIQLTAFNLQFSTLAVSHTLALEHCQQVRDRDQRRTRPKDCIVRSCSYLKPFFT